METIRDDFHRTTDGQIDYGYYKALAAELRREERKRVVLVAAGAGAAAVRDLVTAAIRAFSMPGKFGGLRR
jgi:hypothetical protein